MVDLIPGTTLPIHTGPGGAQPEGRGQIDTTPQRLPVSLFERLAGRDDLTPGELAFLSVAVRAFDEKPRKAKTISDVANGQCDSTTGNLVLPIFKCPSGCEAHVTQVMIDAPNSSTITGAAPFSDVAAWAFLAVAGSTTGTTNANADALRRGAVAFAPAASAGPWLPGQWVFTDKQAPVMFGGSQLYLVIHGASVGALTSLSVSARYRIELYGVEQ